ncbi:MAG: hypothetical protein JSW70_00485 [Syntrophobacterales bacterium]|nr:MAG: hypothetical protein JSW70_00485 [Syntrophobacterales bacterium]
MGKRKEKKRKAKGLSYSDETLQAVQTIIERIGLYERQGEDPQRSFEFVSQFLGKSDELDAAIAEGLARIPSRATGMILIQMKTSCRSKPLLKAIKKSLYRLKQKGLSVEDMKERERRAPVIRPLPRSQPKGFMSGIDYVGNRLIVLTLPRIPRGLNSLEALVSDIEGLVNFHRNEMTRKTFTTFLGNLRERVRLPIVEIPPAYGRFLLEEAYALTEKMEKIPPQDFLTAKREISDIEDGIHGPLIYQFLDQDEIKGNDRFLADSKNLLAMEDVINWVLEPEEIEPYVRAVREAEESRIALNPKQKEEWLRGIYQRALGELFPAERRLLYKRRLEEMAYILFKLGRSDEARCCLAAALDLEKEISSFRPNPFLLQLVITSIYRFMAEKHEKAEAKPSLIIRP